MASNDNDNGKKSVWSAFQWVSLMITIIGMNTVSILYITRIQERMSIVETRQESLSREQARAQLQMEAMQKVLTDGMTLRVVLQADAINMKKQLDRIEDLVIEHMRTDKTK